MPFRLIHGIDFSGAKDAGKRIWIASGNILDHSLHINEVKPAVSLPASGKNRDACYNALRKFIRNERDAIIGLDFPFSLPRQLIQAEASWDKLVIGFHTLFNSPEKFREICRTTAAGREIRRVTDRDAQTPFSPYNIPLYRQTYFGIDELLRPLVKDDVIRVFPMQTPKNGKPCLVEICPASTLKVENLYRKYKGTTAQHRSNRERILDSVLEGGPVQLSEHDCQRVIENSEGDALDSIVAAFAVYRNFPKLNLLVPQNDSLALVEGHVFM